MINFADLQMKVPRSRYRSSPTSEIIFIFIFSNSELLANITTIWSNLPTAACWSREKRDETEANLLYHYVQSDFGTTDTTDKSLIHSVLCPLNLIVNNTATVNIRF